MENRTTIQITEDLRKQLKVLAARRDISYQELLQDMISVFKELNQEKILKEEFFVYHLSVLDLLSW